MAFSNEEGQVFEAFKKEFGITGPVKTKYELAYIARNLDIDKAHLYCDFVANILLRNYAMRKTIINFSNVLKNAIFVMFEEPYVKDIAGKYRAQELSEVYWHLLLVEAQCKQVDSYFLYLEKNREPKDKFYQPRRRKFLEFGLPQALQGLIDDEYDILCISACPGSGKTSLEKFFNSGVIGWFPKDYNLFYSHSGDITRMYYDGVLQICSDHDEYTWNEIFPDIQITSTNAKMQQFNVGAYKPFPSLQTTSVGSESAGKVRASKFLLVDDMIGKMEEALNKNYLDKLWNAYSVDARQRKTNDTDGHFCKEIIIATRWSVHDVIGRVERMYEGNPRVKIIAIPATQIDEKTGLEVSNFDYDFGGFTVENFHDQQLLMDDISYKCLYMQQPIEREGLLYHEEDLRHYANLPETDPDAIVGICDTKSSGIDYMFLPVLYQYGEDYYCVDCICDNSSDFDAQYKRITDIILEHNMQQLEFESNAGGDRIAFEVSKRVEEAGGRCNITRHPTETNKETRIIVNSDWVKKHVLFKEKELYGAQSPYGKMMSFLLSYSETGKNKNDDVPDGWAIFAEFITKRLYRFKRKTVIMKSPI